MAQPRGNVLTKSRAQLDRDLEAETAVNGVQRSDSHWLLRLFVHRHCWGIPCSCRGEMVGRGPTPTGLASGSRIGRAAEPGKDFSNPGVIPVAEGRAQDVAVRRPGSAFEHPVPLVKIRHGIALIGIGGESGVWMKPRRGPLPHVSARILA